MSGNDTIIVDDPEIFDLINEATALTEKLNYITAINEYEKKCNIIFMELDKDLTNWGKSIKKYVEKLEEVQQLEECVKHELIKRLEIPSIGDDIKLFMDRLKQLEEIFNEHIKVNCPELVSNDEVNKLKDLEETIDTLREELSQINEVFEESSDGNKKAVEHARVLQRATKILAGINTIESQLNTMQRQIVKSGLKIEASTDN